MTTIGIYSDVHGDHEALAAAHAAATMLGCTHHLCCGDLVDEAHSANEVINFVRAHGVQCIRGNHERWFLAGAANQCPHGALSAANRVFLQQLPAEITLTVDNTTIALHHASPGSDMEVIFPEDLTPAEIRSHLAAASCDVLLVGHTHRPMLATHPGGGLIANPGALGRPPYIQAAHLPAESGTFGVLTLPERDFVVYDLKGARVRFARTTGNGVTHQ